MISVNRGNPATIAKIFGISYATITAIDPNHLAGFTTSLLANVNNCTFTDAAQDNFLMNVNNKGEYAGALNSTKLSPTGPQANSTHTTLAITSLCGKVYATGSIDGDYNFCDSHVSTSLKRGLFWWVYGDCDTLNCK